MPLKKHVIWVCALLLSLAMAGCGDGAVPGSPGATDDGERKPLRLVSLSPALTQIIRDMGHGSLIVGVDDSHTLVFDDLDLPTVGTYDNASAEAIIGLNPTHVLVMAGAEGPPAALTKQAQTGGYKVVSFQVPTNVREVIGILMGRFVMPPSGEAVEPQVSAEDSLARLLGSDHGGLLVANEMQRQLARIAELSDGASEPGKRPRVLVAFALEPRVQAAGPHTVLDDLLTQYAGAYNAAIPELRPLTSAELNAISDPEKRRAAVMEAASDPATRVGTAPTLDRERLVEARPEVIILIMPGEPALQGIDEDPRLVNLRGLEIPAVKNKRIVLINDKTALLPATTLPLVAAQMAKGIHPQLADKIDAVVSPAPKAATPDEGAPEVAPEAPKAEVPSSPEN